MRLADSPLAPWLAPRPEGAPRPPVLSLGTMNFGARTPAPEAHRIVHRAQERGILWFDTANAYGSGESERILGQALKGRRAQVGIATKAGLARVQGKPEGLAAATVERALEQSLERLGTDAVDLFYLHQPDPAVPLEETLGAVERLLRAGKARHWGVSNFAAWQVLELNTLCDARGMPRPAVSQVMYNLLVRQIELEYLPFTRRYPVHTTVYNPLAGGVLTGRYAPGAAPPRGSRLGTNRLYQNRYGSERLLAQVEALGAVASDGGMTRVELAYAWLLARPGVDSVLVGPGSVEHLDAALEAQTRVLSPDTLARVEDLFQAFTGTDARYAR
ncbi:Predicted oxidoreductase [Stigmatella aurantiaca]|uniref:Predicted oxidoreductase n=1 Tax=Stigmatella aurantiaca TaxID=41 RepID=A0A1H7JGG4_STIAU|nr:aldo/keto reductase [Stigmatella aurantiaca]SEK73514.1 Predicted oxidoreductase [Stigmatella aurantiaca]